MVETPVRQLRKAEESISDLPKSPPRFAERDTLATTMYVPVSADMFTPRRSCPTATLILEMCQSGEFSRIHGDRISMMKHLLQLGFDVDGSDNRVRGPFGHGSPLMSAVRYPKTEKARFLLENGADPNLKTWWGKSLFEQVQQLRHPNLLDLFQKHSPITEDA